MERLLKFGYLGLIIVLTTASCSIEKRVYLHGYHIEWNRSFSSTSPQKIVVLQDDQLDSIKESRFPVSSENSFRSTINDMEITVNEKGSLDSEDADFENVVSRFRTPFRQSFGSVHLNIENEVISTDDQTITSSLKKISKNRFDQNENHQVNWKRGLLYALVSLALIGIGYLFYVSLGVFGTILFIIFGIGGAILLIMGIVMMFI
jgi:hypothetical protein